MDKNTTILLASIASTVIAGAGYKLLKDRKKKKESCKQTIGPNSGFDTIKLDTIELDTIELDTIELDTFELDPFELDPFELDNPNE